MKEKVDFQCIYCDAFAFINVHLMGFMSHLYDNDMYLQHSVTAART